MVKTILSGTRVLKFGLESYQTRPDAGYSSTRQSPSWNPFSLREISASRTPENCRSRVLRLPSAPGRRYSDGVDPVETTGTRMTGACWSEAEAVILAVGSLVSKYLSRMDLLGLASWARRSLVSRLPEFRTLGRLGAGDPSRDCLDVHLLPPLRDEDLPNPPLDGNDCCLLPEPPPLGPDPPPRWNLREA